MKIGIVIKHFDRRRASRYVGEVGRRFVQDDELHVFANTWDEIDRRILIHKIPALSRNFYINETSFLAFATAIMKTQKLDVAMAQPTRYFSPDVGYMQFVYKEWTNYKKENRIRPTLGEKMVSVIERMNVKKARKIIVMSNVLKEQVLRNYGVPEEKIEVVYSGVNCEEFKPENKKLYGNNMRKKFGIEENDIVLFFMGNPFSRKGLEYAIRALPLIKEKRVKILVSGNDNPERYKELAKKLGVHEKIRWNIGLTNEINKFFATGDIFVLPTLYEPFGLVITDAMASGLPVVVSRRAGAAELIEDGKSGLLLDNPKNPEEIAEKINMLIKDKRLRNRLYIQARNAAERHGWERAAERWLKVFEEIK